MAIESAKLLKAVGLRLRQLRIARGWTLEEAEERGFPSWRHLQKIEGGKNITLQTLFNLSKLYKIHPSDILKDL